MRHLDDIVPADQPLRVIRVMVNSALVNMDELFAQMYAAHIKVGRPSIAPEKLLPATLIQVLYSVLSERQLMEQTSTTCCFAVSSAWPWTMPCGCLPSSAETVNA